MRIAIVCNDTRGGVQPYVALGMGLAGAGHDVRVIAPANHASLFENSGLKLFTLSGPPADQVDAAARIAEKGTFATMAYMAREMPKMIFRSTSETLEGCQGVDLITGGVGGMVIGLSVADKLKIPFIPTHLQPVGAASTGYPGVMLGALPNWIGDWGRLLSHKVSEKALWMPFEGAMARAREKVLGLRGPSRAMDGQPVIYGFSRHVVRVPEEKVKTQPSRYTTGYWILEPSSKWTAPEKLRQFIERDGPIVCFGFGSMSSARAAEVTSLVQMAVAEVGVRALFIIGSGGLVDTTSDNIYCVSEAPHEWLFRKVSAIVHHGGAGTTAAALRSGVPNIVVPFAVDQPFWGSRVAALGVGPRPIPYSRLTVERLSQALRIALDDSKMRQRASKLGAILRDEDGVAEAVEYFDRLQN